MDEDFLVPIIPESKEVMAYTEEYSTDTPNVDSETMVDDRFPDSLVSEDDGMEM